MTKVVILHLKIVHIRSLFRFKNGFAELVCYDMSKKSNKTDRFAITLKNSRFGKFLTEEAYN